jgi:hypothetical protein
VTRDHKCHTLSKVHLSPFLLSAGIAGCVVFQRTNASGIGTKYIVVVINLGTE